MYFFSIGNDSSNEMRKSTGPDRSWRARVWERVGCGYDDLILMGDAVSDAKALAV